MIGSIAACLTTFAFVPQVIKVVKTNDTESLSLSMYVMQVMGIAFWAVHGYLINDFALMLANSVTLFLAFIILASKIRNDWKKKKIF